MTTTALYATQNMIHIRDQCPPCHAVVSSCTASVPPKEQSHTCLKPLKVQAVYLNGSQDWEEQPSTEHTPSQQGIPRLTAGALYRREPVSRLTEAAPTSSSLCTEYSCASRARDRPSPR